MSDDGISKVKSHCACSNRTNVPCGYLITCSKWIALCSKENVLTVEMCRLFGFEGSWIRCANCVRVFWINVNWRDRTSVAPLQCVRQYSKRNAHTPFDRSFVRWHARTYTRIRTQRDGIRTLIVYHHPFDIDTQHDNPSYASMHRECVILTHWRQIETETLIVEMEKVVTSSAV